MKTNEWLNTIQQGDWNDLAKQLDDESIDLIVLDPPYYKIKDVEWDNQWKDFKAYLDWIEEGCIELKRVLKSNGSIYIFGDDHRIAYIQTRLDKHFHFLNHLVWYKRNNVTIKYASGILKYANVSERILFYDKGNPTGNEMLSDKYASINPFSKYLKEEFERAKISNKEIAKLFPSKMGNMTGCVSNWLLGYNCPLKGQYETIKEFLGRDYLRREYEDLRRVYNYQYGIYEIIDIPIINPTENTEHPTTKPMALIEILVKASTNEENIVLDPFAGSGTTCLVARKLSRQFIGFELNPKYIEIANNRLKPYMEQKKLSEVLNEFRIFNKKY